MKVPVVLQANAGECGIACLAMVAAAHGRAVGVAEIRRRVGYATLGNSLKALMLTPRGGVLQPRDSADQIRTDYGNYTNSLNGLAQLVRVWDRAVLTGTLDTGLISSERIQTHDDLLNSVRARTLALYRQYVQLDRRMADLSCRSEWFARDPSQSREDRLVALPAGQ